MPDLFGAKSLPFLTRRNYSREMLHIAPWSLLAGLLEGQFATIVVARSFGGSDLLIAIASATPAASFLFSLYWGALCVGRSKLRLITLFCLLTVLATGMMGAIPATKLGGVWFVAQMAVAQSLLSGVVTVRSALWRLNYPHSDRGRIAARLQVVRFLMSTAVVLVAARVCDADPTAYRFVFPAAAVVGFLSIGLLRGIRVRRERAELERVKEAIEPFPAAPPVSAPRRMIATLRSDRRYAKYCVAQSLMGVANLMTIPVVVAIVANRIDFGDAQIFWISTGLIQALPQLTRLGSLPRWAKHFDRVGVVRFRVMNVACWTVSLAFGWAATMVVLQGDAIGGSYVALAAGLFAMRGLVGGLALGGGAIAWNLGHLHFSKSEQAEVYMGVHVFLTGCRGILAPSLGMFLWKTTGLFTWVVAITLSVLSGYLFRLMSREEQEEARATVDRTG